MFSLIKLGLTLESLKDLWYDEKNAWKKESTPAPSGQRDRVTGCKRGSVASGGKFLLERRR